MNQPNEQAAGGVCLRNVFLDNYLVPRNGSWLVVTPSSCFKLSDSTKTIISHLPEKAKSIEYVEELRQLGVPEPERIVARLVEMKCLVPVSGAPWYRTLLDRLMYPSVELIPSKLQERLFFFLKGEESDSAPLFRFALSACFLGIALSTSFFAAKGFSAVQALNLSQPEQWAAFIVLLISILAHELGHSVFAYLNGIGFRPIGFSLYLMYPVFYANVSGIGQLPLRRKLSINLAGIGLQSLFMAGVGIAWVATGWGVYLLALQYMAFLTLFNLNPLINTDGYWCYRDIVSEYKGNRVAVAVERAYSVAALGFSVYLLYAVGRMLSGVWEFFMAWPWSAAGLAGALINAYVLVIVVKGVLLRFKENFAALKQPWLSREAPGPGTGSGA